MKQLLLLISLFVYLSPADAAVWYVRATAPNGGNGQSWATAFKNLDAITAVANAGDQVWVAEGTYVPANGANRTSSFVIPGGVAVFAGFKGNETALWQRNILNNLTILSGERGTPSLNDNVATIVKLQANQQLILIDGFIIERGYSDLVIDNAAGIEAGVNVGYTIRNCIFRDNTKDASAFSGAGEYGRGGGAIRSAHTSAGPITIEGCYFINNRDLSSDGGAINITETAGGANLMGGTVSHIVINRCFFKGNFAQRYGGAVALYSPSNLPAPFASFTNCVFEGNNLGFEGNFGALFAMVDLRLEHCSATNNQRIPISGFVDLSQPIGRLPFATNTTYLFNNVITANPSSLSTPAVYGIGPLFCDNNYYSNATGFPGTIVDDIQFVNSITGDLRLRPSSSGLNAGNASYTTVAVDFLGRPRIALGAPDIGAFEMTNLNKPIIYVNESSNLLPIGFAWGAAIPNPLTEVSSATRAVQFWIAEGTYHNVKPSPNNNGQVFDELCADCDYIGGFQGNENNVNQASFTREVILTGAPDGATPTLLTLRFNAAIGRSTLRNLVFEDNNTQASVAKPVIEVDNQELLALEFCTFRSCTSRPNAIAISITNTDTLLVEQCRFLSSGTSNMPAQPVLIRAEGLNAFTMNQSIIEGNQFIEGVLHANGGDATISDCLFEDNACSHFVTFHKTPSVNDQRMVRYERCSFLGNAFVPIEQVIPAIVKTTRLQTATVECTLFGNNTFNAFGDFEATNVVLRNLTVSNFTGAQSKFLSARKPSGTASTGTFSLTNSVIVNATLSGGVYDIVNSHFGSIVTSALATNPGTVGTPSVANLITSNPYFVDADNGNFRPASWSPLVNAGSNTFAQGIDFDLAFVSRILDGTVDIGAYERPFGCFPDNDACGVAVSVLFNTDIAGSNRCANIGSDPISSCNVNVGKTVWYSFVAPADGTAEVVTSGVMPVPGYNQFNMKQTIYTGDCDGLTEVACTNDFIAGFGETTLLSDLVPDQMYYIRLEGVNQQEGFYTLRVNANDATCLGDLNDDALVNTADLLVLLSEFGNACATSCTADLDGGGSVGASDLLIFLSVFGSVCN